MKTVQPKYIRWFSQLSVDDVALVGGKNASLGEMYRELTPQGLRIPNGFAVTAEAFRYVLEQAGAVPRLHEALDGLVESDVDDLARRAQKAREIIYGAALPPDLVEEISAAYSRLRDEYGETLTLAVRSSATAEDLPTASFAGQHETFLNIAGEERLLDAVRLCFASLFKDRAISYRIENGFDHFKVFLSVGVMKMVRSDRASSGVIFSLDTETGFRDVVFITGAYGLGENVVQGTVDPDEFYVFKPTFRQGKRGCAAAQAGRQGDPHGLCQGGWPRHDAQRAHRPGGSATILHQRRRRRSRWPMPPSRSRIITAAGQATPCRWTSSGRGTAWTASCTWCRRAPRRSPRSMRRASSTNTRLESTGAALVTGRAVGGRVASGPARVISDLSQLNEFRPGEVLVADTTMPDWGTVMKIAAAVVTNRGGRTCHAAIVARELGIPAVVGCDNATTALRSGDMVTVSCAEGSVGRVYRGRGCSVQNEYRRIGDGAPAARI